MNQVIQTQLDHIFFFFTYESIFSVKIIYVIWEKILFFFFRDARK